MKNNTFSDTIVPFVSKTALALEVDYFWFLVVSSLDTQRQMVSITTLQQTK